jgi:hypothetical protein
VANRNTIEAGLRCYRCGSTLAELTLPLSRLELCPSCSVELHVCRMCSHYAPSQPDACDEDDAIPVQNKTTANFCDYFAPSNHAFSGAEKNAEDRARRQLDALFGGSPAVEAPAAEMPAGGASSGDDALRAAEDLFRKR